MCGLKLVVTPRKNDGDVCERLRARVFFFRFVWEIVVGGRGAEVLAKLTLAPPPVSSSAEAQCAKNIDQDYI